MTDTNFDYPVPDDFYRMFEDRFRGSQELISGRLEAYIPFLRALGTESDSPRGFDLGCGRGEWLVALERDGFEAVGVDLDDGMLQAARDRGLNVERKDAIEALVDAPEAEYDVISGFHIFEHLTFPARLMLVREAFRALRPGGILILETPNPENVMVGTWSFHLDPSHVAPIPPMVMPFLAEYAGFADSAILRLHTPPPGEDASLTDVFTKVGCDFALVARKAGPDNKALNELFETPVGLDIYDALSRFDTAAQGRWSAGENAVAQVEANLSRFATAAQDRWSAGENAVAQIDAELSRFATAAQDRWSAGENAVAQVDAKIATLSENVVATAGRVSECSADITEQSSALADLERALRADLGRQKAAFENLDTDARAELANIRVEIGALQTEIEFLRQRNLFQILFFRPSGRPVKLLRRLAFHSNGRPRGGVLLGWIARRRNGTPRRAFVRWMESAEYAALPWPAKKRAARAAAAAPPPAAAPAAAPTHPGFEEFFGPRPEFHPRRYEVWARLDSAQRQSENAE